MAPAVALLGSRTFRVEGHLPKVPVRVLEVTSVAAPERALSWLDDPSARALSLGHDFAYFSFRLDIVGKGEAAGTDGSDGESRVGCQAGARPECQLEARFKLEERHRADLELCAHDSRCRQTQAIAVEGERTPEVFHGKRDETDPWLHASGAAERVGL